MPSDKWSLYALMLKSRLLEEAIAKDRLVSVSLAVVLDRDIIFCQAFGHADLKQKKPATSRTIFPIISVTKVFSATMLARLWEQGMVSLEDPVQTFLHTLPT